MENAKSENPHSCHKKRDFRLLFYFLLSKDLQSRGLFKIVGSGYEKKRKFGNFGHTKHSRNIPTVSKEPQTDRTLIRNETGCLRSGKVRN